ncbi:leucine-rich repeat-containing protein 71-like [Histomonas meleagridis]|uniref:leucine-rich repeat-containing protein 71-like n=1 Tax=Histomonas meleagridis TaxID=135588 RepID=UPI00355981FA|nr:leucine-rich repeat-containing protein 71-like [Histomonas meleagridis]KAH0797347.1 leucine-rich repeat-containing protein 71-like [Histomonas meleagridis]
MPPRKGATQQKKDINPIVAEFQQSCKVYNFQDEEVINQILKYLNTSETIIRLVNITLTPILCKVLIRVFQKCQKLQQIILYSCYIMDPNFPKLLLKITTPHLVLDYTQIQREFLIPLLSSPTLDILSLCGNQCLTPYNYITHELTSPYPPSLNLFFNSLTTSTIKVLNLYGCNIGDVGAISLSNCLFFNTTLRCISLSRNRIGDEGAKYLAASLSHYELNEQETLIVEQLINEENKQKISDEGGGLIKRKKGQKNAPKRQQVKTPTKKTRNVKQNVERQLNFDPAAPVKPIIMAKWNNCIMINGGKRVIPGNNVVTSLILDENLITENGAFALRDMLKLNNNIVQFSIDHNPEVDEKLACELKRQIKIE